MSEVTAQPGRQIHLDLIVDHERGRVQIIRNLDQAKGFLCKSANMGWVEIEEFRQFIASSKGRLKANRTLLESMTNTYYDKDKGEYVPIDKA